MSHFNSSLYRGYRIFTAVIPNYPPDGGFSARVTVELDGKVIGSDSTDNLSHFIFAEGAARHLGHEIVDAALQKGEEGLGKVDQE